jgi:hypothetical protein
MGTIQESFEDQREQEWRQARVPEPDILFSRRSGIDARDVGSLRGFSTRRLIIIVRNPKVTARAWHGVLPPKNIATKAKTGSSGVVVTSDQRIFVTDYDLMSVWRTATATPEKIFISAANGAARGKWTQEAVALVVELNGRLISKIQHGCQDDFQSASNPGVKPTDHFSAFHGGLATHLPTPGACAAFYEKQQLPWPYDTSGKYSGPIASAM